MLYAPALFYENLFENISEGVEKVNKMSFNQFYMMSFKSIYLTFLNKHYYG